MPLFSADTANPAIQFWMSALCMATAAILAPGSIIGIAAFPLFIVSIVYGLKGFRLLPAAQRRARFRDTVWFTIGLLGTLLASILHGSIAFAFAHPGSGAMTPPLLVTLPAGLVPVALCAWAVERRTERRWAIAITLVAGLILVDPVVLLVGRTLVLPGVRSW